MLHAGLAIAIKILFFAHKSPATRKAPPAGKGDAAKGGGGGHGKSGNGGDGSGKGGDDGADDGNDDARMLVEMVRMVLRI